MKQSISRAACSGASTGTLLTCLKGIRGVPGEIQLSKLYAPHLLWELVGSINIVPSGDDNGHLVRRHVGLAKHLGAGLRSAVGVGGVQVAGLLET